MSAAPAIWFPTVRTGTGTDVFTERLVEALSARGMRAEITWLPLRAEYAPWSVTVPAAPEWATVCHINTWLHPRFIPRQLPVVATLHHSIHDPALHPYKGWLRATYHRWWIAPIERRVLRRADQVVAVSRFVADMARPTLCDVPMQIIYNGIDTALFRPGSRVRQLDEPFRMLYVGSWMARKGVDLLAPIMRELGDGFELQYTGGPAAQSESAGMPANMHDIGRLSAAGVRAAMKDADAFLFPSRSEGLPLVVVEAIASGLPVVGVRDTSTAEVIQDGNNGFLCARDDVSAFVGAIHLLASDKNLSASMRKAARRVAEEGFTFTSMVRSYVEQYRKLHEAS